MADESRTVRITRDELRSLGYYDDAAIAVEEQRSDNEEIDKLLSKARKAETGRRGMPEFIIWKKSVDTVVIIECKASVEDHASRDYGQPEPYAVDGVLHYAKFLKDGYNVVAIAVSGDKDAVKTSVFLWDKRGSTYGTSPRCEIEKFDRYVERFRPNPKNTHKDANPITPITMHRGDGEAPQGRPLADELEKIKPIKSVTFSYDGRGSRHEYSRDGKFERHVSLETEKGGEPKLETEYYED